MMNSIRMHQSETYYPGCLESSSAVTAIEYRICKLSDGTWWDFTALAFQAAPADPSGALTEDDNGLWIDSTGWAIPDADATYKVLFEITNPAETFFKEGPEILVKDSLMNEFADALLNRDMSAAPETNDRSPLNALRFLRNKWSIAAGTLTVTKEDDATSAWTSTVTGDATANPIVSSDPA